MTQSTRQYRYDIDRKVLNERDNVKSRLSSVFPLWLLYSAGENNIDAG